MMSAFTTEADIESGIQFTVESDGLPVTGVMDERTWIAPAGAAGATLESLSGLKL
jgi:hypothetical protein